MSVFPPIQISSLIINSLQAFFFQSNTIWISVKILINTVSKIKTKIMLDSFFLAVYCIDISLASAGAHAQSENNPEEIRGREEIEENFFVPEKVGK